MIFLRYLLLLLKKKEDSMERTLADKIEKIKNFRPIDDVFFEVLAANKAVCQEILSTILEDKGLIVENVIVQSSIRNLYGRSVQLDCLCILGSGKKVNIEVQRSDNDNHFKRVRYNESIITAKETNTGDTFDSITDLIVVYISEFDFIKGGKTTYHVDKIIRETGETVNDGVQEIYVNTVVDDASDIADLMSCFTKKMVDNPKFPEFSAEVKRIKETEGGNLSMCKIMQELEDKARDEGRKEGMKEGEKKGMQEGIKKGMQEGRKEGVLVGTIKALRQLVSSGIITAAVAAQQCGMTEEAFLQAKTTI